MLRVLINTLFLQSSTQSIDCLEDNIRAMYSEAQKYIQVLAEYANETKNIYFLIYRIPNTATFKGSSVNKDRLMKNCLLF